MVCNSKEEGSSSSSATCCCIKKRTCCGLAIQLFLILLVAGILCLAYIPSLIHKTIISELSLDGPTSKLYPSFLNSTEQGVNVYDKYWFFNVENPWEVDNLGAKPNLTLKGPYTYLHIKWRPEEYTSWRPDGTIEYRSLVNNTFVPELSVEPNEDAVICTPRTGVLIALQEGIANGAEDLILTAIDLAKVTSLLQNRTVYELIHGYKEPVLEILAPILDLAGQPTSPIVAFEPDTLDPTQVLPTRMYSGFPSAANLPDPPKYSLGEYTMYAGQTKLDYWGSDEANTIKGTGATMYAPLMMLDTSRKLYAYVSDISRSVTLIYGSSNTKDGITGHIYRLDDNLFKNETFYPPNAGYFITTNGFQTKPPAKFAKSGKAIPPDQVFASISKWLFLDADQSVINCILPRPANRETDDISLEYEPITSTLLEAHKRLQLSLHFHPIPGVNASLKLGDSRLPVFMVDETATLPEKDRKTLKEDVLIPLLIVLAAGITLCVIGSIGFIVSVFCCCRAPKTDDDVYNDDYLDSDRKLLNNSKKNFTVDRQDSFSPQGREFQAK